MAQQKFWLEEPCQLTASATLLPSSGDSLGAQLNSLTRLAIAAGVTMYALKYKNWAIVLALSLASIVLLWLLGRQCNQKTEGFSVTPNYMGTDFHQTTLAPTYAEEWQIPPQAYEQYIDAPPQVEYVSSVPDPRSYPYGQYLTSMNLLPEDERAMNSLESGSTTAREYANSAFLRHDLAYRDDMMRLQKLKLARRFRHNCNDVVSPYNSY